MGKIKVSSTQGKFLEISGGDITVDKKYTPEDFKYIRNTIKDMLAISDIEDGDVCFVKGYHSVGDGGGGYFYWDANEDKANHNGGTIIDPNIAFPTDWSNTTQQSIWFTAGTGSGCWKRIYDGAVNVKWFGAKGDYDGVTGTDDYLSFQAAINNCNLALTISAGNYKITDSLTYHKVVDITGSGIGQTVLYPVFSSEKYLFHFEDTSASEMYGGAKRGLRHLSVVGTTQYGGNEKFYYAYWGLNIVIENFSLSNLAGGIYLNKSWCSTIQKAYIYYVTNPIRMDIPNASSVRDVYVIRFQGQGLYAIEGLSLKLDNLTFEYGVNSATAIRLQACHNTTLQNLYTEGDMGTDIHLYFKNQRACMNTIISNCWLNSTATKIIHAQSYRGLRIENINLQTPVATKLIDFTDRMYYAGKIIVSNICQFDQNSNGFIGDLRGPGQTLIPITSSANRDIFVDKHHPSYGDQTDADLSNLCNTTVADSSNWYPLSNSASFDANSAISFASAFNGYYSYKTVATLKARATINTTAKFLFSFVATESIGDCTYNYKLLNNTLGITVAENSISGVGTVAGTRFDVVMHVPLINGNNDLVIQLSRKANDGGTTTLTNTFIEQLSSDF